MKVVYRNSNGERISEGEFYNRFGPGFRVETCGPADFTFQVAELRDSGVDSSMAVEVQVP